MKKKIKTNCLQIKHVEGDCFFSLSQSNTKNIEEASPLSKHFASFQNLLLREKVFPQIFSVFYRFTLFPPGTALLIGGNTPNWQRTMRSTFPIWALTSTFSSQNPIFSLKILEISTSRRSFTAIHHTALCTLQILHGKGSHCFPAELIPN